MGHGQMENLLRQVCIEFSTGVESARIGSAQTGLLEGSGNCFFAQANWVPCRKRTNFCQAGLIRPIHFFCINFRTVVEKTTHYNRFLLGTLPNFRFEDHLFEFYIQIPTMKILCHFSQQIIHEIQNQNFSFDWELLGSCIFIKIVRYMVSCGFSI